MAVHVLQPQLPCTNAFYGLQIIVVHTLVIRYKKIEVCIMYNMDAKKEKLLFFLLYNMSLWLFWTTKVLFNENSLWVVAIML
jgi:hypothetical protein